MAKKIVFYGIFFLLNFVLIAQDYISENGTVSNNKDTVSNNRIIDRLIFGGNFMLAPYSYNGYSVFYADVSPMVGYMVTNRLIFGNYFIFRYYGNDYFRFYTTMYGIKPYVRYKLIKNLDDIMPFESNFNTGITLVATQEILNVEKRMFYEGKGRRWISGTFAGFSIVQPIGKKGGFYISILWLVAGNSNILFMYNYTSPMIDIGFYL